ncbi:MAG: DUF3616 domain-containing protein [Pseudomonadota bacterium]
MSPAARYHFQRIVPYMDAMGFCLSKPSARVLLDLSDPGAPRIPLEQDLSAAARIEDTMFVACDETASLERLMRLADGSWGAHEHLRLADYVDLPAGDDSEADIEGLAIDGDWLWLIGSHSLKRKRPKGDPDRLRRIVRDPNRFLLARVPLIGEGPGRYRPARAEGARRAQWVEATPTASKLIDWLRRDEVLAPFLDIPSKENGLDIEGLAVRGMTAWIGLRGPVIRGHAVVVEMQLKEVGHHQLKARRIDGRARYRCHFLRAEGLGVRDLFFEGDDILVLVGPTLSSDGPARLLRWVGGANSPAPGIVNEDSLQHLAELPYHAAFDHPEAVLSWPDAGPSAVLVIYDAPSEARLRLGGVFADVFDLGALARPNACDGITAPVAQ